MRGKSKTARKIASEGRDVVNNLNQAIVYRQRENAQLLPAKRKRVDHTLSVVASA
jgi:hypothetical protein